MARHVVLGTAGHIDHGKTALVKALTGVDTDRLAEEKARGITIDLGFAPLALGDLAVSVVDVPGHEGFIRNMVAGATGVDLALLVVAADEGVMPQTREHLAILRFLGVTRGVVALTKCDLATEAEWRALVAEDVGALVEEAFGRRWPLVEVSAATGAGLEELRGALGREAVGAPSRSGADRFRLPVDRVFALAGAGTIVTGTVWSGSVREGDSVTVLPGDRTARLRSVEVHGARAERAEPGRRAALALVGVDRAAVQRGSVIVAGGAWRMSRAADVAVTMLGTETLPVRRRVRVHHGTAEVMARVARVEGAANQWRVRLMLEEPLVLRAGDRLVLRAYSPVTTIGGGVVLDSWADARTRGRAGRAVADVPSSDGDRVAQLVRRRGATGLTREELEVAAGLDVTRLTAALDQARHLGLARQGDWFVASSAVQAAVDVLAATLERWHASNPLEPGMPLQAWRGAAGPVPAALVAVAERRLSDAGSVVTEASVARLATWVAGAGGSAQILRDRVLEALRAAGAEPPTVAELAAQFGPRDDIPGVLRFLAREGRVVAVGKDRYYEAGVLTEERLRLEAALHDLGSATASAIRERLGRSRKYLIPLLEWADREGVTVRSGDTRTLASRPGA